MQQRHSSVVHRFEVFDSTYVVDIDASKHRDGLRFPASENDDKLGTSTFSLILVCSNFVSISIAATTTRRLSSFQLGFEDRRSHRSTKVVNTEFDIFTKAGRSLVFLNGSPERGAHFDSFR